MLFCCSKNVKVIQTKKLLPWCSIFCQSNHRGKKLSLSCINHVYLRYNRKNSIRYNMRLEPVVYINGMPHAPRHPDRSPFSNCQINLKIPIQIINKTCKSRMHEDLDIEASVDELNDLEEKFANIVKERVAANPELK